MALLEGYRNHLKTLGPVGKVGSLFFEVTGLAAAARRADRYFADLQLKRAAAASVGPVALATELPTQQTGGLYVHGDVVTSLPARQMPENVLQEALARAANSEAE